MYENIINDYIGEVTKDMGPGQRTEVARELRTHILDSADALAAERKIPVDEVIVREVIARMGPAEKIAAMYPSRETFLVKSGVWKVIQVLGGLAVAFMMLAGIIWLVAPEFLDVPLQIILSLVFALAVAMVSITAIFFCIYFYESRLKVPYEARLKRFNKSLNEAASPIKIAFAIIGTIVWLVLLTVFWSKVPFLSDFGENPQLIPLLTQDFGNFVPYFILLGILTIAVQLLYLVIRQKWVPSLLEVFLSCGSALLMIWILRVFPFNPAFIPQVQAGIKVLLVLAVIGCLFDAAKKLWQTAQFFIGGMTENNNAV